MPLRPTTRLRLPATDLEVSRLVLGSNVFGWTADEETSHTVLDAYVDAGGNFIDTADSYSFWAPGNSGGVAESIIGRWLKTRGTRDEMIIATKVSQHPDFKGLAPSTIRAGVEASLRRLGIDVIDLYYAHFDDLDTPLEESISALSRLVDEGKVRYLGISNFSAERIEEWLRTVEVNGFHRPVAIEQMYSLVERDVEKTTLPIARRAQMAFFPYYVLARGFLTGKYRNGVTVDSPRAEAASAYLNERGRRVLAALEEVAIAHGVEMATAALAWTASQPGIAAPISSARNTGQLMALLAFPALELTDAELAALTVASSETA